MPNRPLLSICIPTYNRAGYLIEAVESILAQTDPLLPGEVEVVISDNASTDGSQALVERLFATSKHSWRYFRNEQNVGFDANCLLAVERAQGEYVWILGDDDLLASAALNYVLDQLKLAERIDLYLGEKTDFYLTSDRPMRFRRIMDYPGEKIFDFGQPLVMADYFRRQKKLVAFCNYISNIVFRRNKWQAVNDKERYVGTGYIHVYIFQSILWGRASGRLKYLPQPLVARRWGNDGNADPEFRLRQDVLMFRRIAEAVFTDRKYVRQIDALVIRNDAFSWAVRMKLADWNRFIFSGLPFLFRAYWPQPLFWLKMAPLVVMPNIVLNFIRQTYRLLIKGEPINE